jgi:aryl-alcohol dehydrogenase-like predicted oxidoreductase
MKYRQLGKSGVRVSVIGLGANRFGYERMPQVEVNRVIDAAFDLGINFLDSADSYQNGRSEETIGVALADKRNHFVVATKYFNQTGPGPNDWGASRYHLYDAVEASLRRLRTDHIDLLYVHNFDETTPPGEMLRGLDDLVRAGKVRYIGASNFLAWQIACANLMADFHGWSPFVAVQAQYHMLERKLEGEMLSYCRNQGVGIIPYFPLAGGFLTGKYKRDQPAPTGSRGESSQYVQKYMTSENYSIIERLSEWAEHRGRTPGEVAHAWLLAHSEVSSVISGATRLEQVQENAKAADWNLTPDETAEVNRILEGQPSGS